ncbi:MAG: Asp-tRNA(Asn)/Glu-tRNA(Gln) amidotransferase subunit GatB [Anaerolineales bacterium]|nr:Asp-tRNA(Asn)/Glu-tRNA(Gln) amidotransferase subunit GatB [Anaerolineales bacterium]
MPANYEAVIGLEVHAELQTRSKMFCSCPVVDPTGSEPNVAVCPVCTGMPGVLPVTNRMAVEYALRVALALECEIYHTSIFARKNYFYPDLPKGYQISQYEYPLARHGRLTVYTPDGEKTIRIRRVHLEEDTGKLTHVSGNGDSYSLVDINRAGVPLLEIVSEPDLHTAEDVRAFAAGLRDVLRYLEVNTGDMEKGFFRIEPNISVRPLGSEELGTRVEVKNLNSFRALERSVDYEIKRQVELIESGRAVIQQTVGWDERAEEVFVQRTKETEDDYRYFPEPDLPPLVVDEAWIEEVRRALPELPVPRQKRFESDLGLSFGDAATLVAEKAVADYFELAVAAGSDLAPTQIANWVRGEVFGLMNQDGLEIDQVRVTPAALVDLIRLVERGEINNNTAKAVLAEMFATGESADTIISARGLRQISESGEIARLVSEVLEENPDQVDLYQGGKTTVINWLFGQGMRKAGGRANPQVLRAELEKQLNKSK